MSIVPDTQAADLLEYLVRHAMVEHSLIAPRGFDSIRKRRQIHDEIDAMLDRIAEMRE